MPTSSVSDTPDLTVILTSCRPPVTVVPTLDSLRTQTLPAACFEVLLVANGPATDDLSLYRRYQQEHPHFRLRVVTSPVAGLVASHTLGIAETRTPWLTFVDDDDTVSPRFLESLLAAVRPATVPATVVHAVAPDGSLQRDTYVTRALKPIAGRTARGRRRRVALSSAVGKLVPTAWARTVAVPEHLQTGWDIAFYSALHAQRRFRVRVVAEPDEAVYYAHQQPGSASRPLSLGTRVEQRMELVVALSDLADAAPWTRRWHIIRQASVVRAKVARLLREQPDVATPQGWDEYAEPWVIDRVLRPAATVLRRMGRKRPS